MQKQLFLNLPTEIRLQVYADMMPPFVDCSGPCCNSLNNTSRNPFNTVWTNPLHIPLPSILLTCGRTYWEALDTYLRYAHYHACIQWDTFTWTTSTGKVLEYNPASLPPYEPNPSTTRNLVIKFNTCVNEKSINILVKELQSLSVVRLVLHSDWPAEMDNSALGAALGAVEGLKEVVWVDFHGAMTDVPLQGKDVICLEHKN